MYLFTADRWEGELARDCAEGDLEWVPGERVPELPVWAGDRIFLRLLAEDAPPFLLTLEYAGGELMPREEENVALYVHLVDTEGAAFWRFPLRKESEDVNIFYFLPPGKVMGHGIPLEIGLSESEVALLRKYSST